MVLYKGRAVELAWPSIRLPRDNKQDGIGCDWLPIVSSGHDRVKIDFVKRRLRR